MTLIRSFKMRIKKEIEHEKETKKQKVYLANYNNK